MNSVAKESEYQQSLNEQLRNKFHLNLEPFGETLQLFFQGGQRQHNLETLRHLVNFGDMVLLLTGDSGSGKTTLIRELKKCVEDNVSVVSLKPSLISSPKKLVSELCKKFSVPQVDGEPSVRSMDRVTQHFSQDAAIGKRTLLIVDDAHKTNKEAFQLLVSTFKKLSGEAGVCLLISGRKGVLHSMTLEGVEPDNCSWVHQIQLKPLSCDDATAYVSARLVRAGAVAVPDLSSAQSAALHELGKGCPGRINRIAPAVLLDVFGVSEEKTRSPKGVSWLLAGISVSLLVSFLVIAYQYNLFYSSSEVGALVTVQADPVVSSEEFSARARLAEVITRETLPPSPFYLPDGEIKSTKDLSVVSASEVLESMEEPKGAGLEKDTAVSVEKSAIEEVKIEPLKEKSDVPVGNVAGLAEASAKLKIQDVPVPPKAGPEILPIKQVKVAEGASGRHAAFRSEAWVNTQPSSAYTIQVLGSRSEETTIKYIDKAGDSVRLFYLESTYKGGAWFVVISNIYDNKESARKALSALPVVIKKQKPWLRSVKGLQSK